MRTKIQAIWSRLILQRGQVCYLKTNRILDFSIKTSMKLINTYQSTQNIWTGWKTLDMCEHKNVLRLQLAQISVPFCLWCKRNDHTTQHWSFSLCMVSQLVASIAQRPFWSSRSSTTTSLSREMFINSYYCYEESQFCFTQNYVVLKPKH